MSYRHILNLYANREILSFKQCYASEKVDGTSANIRYQADQDKLSFFQGGCSRELFLANFDEQALLEQFRANHAEHPTTKDLIIYGEAYGGKLQGRSDTYGKDLKFIAFEVCIDGEFLGVLEAEKLALKFGQEFVPYKLIDTTEEAINAEMMADSEVAIRRGMGPGHMREGIVLRPVVELIHPNGGRIICKHKRKEFEERRHQPKFTDETQLKVLEEAKEIVEEWVVMKRLEHVLDAFTEPSIKDSNKVIQAMNEDVLREAAGEIVDSKSFRKELGKETMRLFKDWLYHRE